MTTPSDRLAAAIHRVIRPASPVTPPDRANVDDWQKFIEVEMSAFNRRLARIEIISVILLVLVVITDASKAADLLRALIPLP